MTDNPWDERNIELGLRDQMAKLIATIVSGVEDAKADDIDYVIADKLRAQIEQDMSEHYIKDYDKFQAWMASRRMRRLSDGK